MTGGRWCKAAGALCAGAALLATNQLAQAQGYPSRPVRMIVPFATGGGTDIQARVFATKLQPLLGQQIIVDNRTGAGGNIGAELVAKAPPDGYTVLFQSASLAVNATLYSKLNYNALRDFAPVLLVSSTPLILVVHPSVPATNVKGLIALARAKPGVFNFGSNSTGTTSQRSVPASFPAAASASRRGHSPGTRRARASRNPAWPESSTASSSAGAWAATKERKGPSISWRAQ